MSQPAITVIVPTLARACRAAVLRRAIDSIVAQRAVDARPLVVVNGSEADPTLLESLIADPRVQVVRCAEASLPGALRAGRERVSTAWFASLDDDDVLLGDALVRRWQRLLDAPDADVVISNGLRRDAHGDAPVMADVRAIEADPLGALARGNWLLPGSWLCRTDRVGPELFDGMPRYLECTFLAIRFASRYRPVFLDQATVRWYANTPDGEHASSVALLGSPQALLALLQHELPAELRRHLRRRLAAAYNACSRHSLRAGRRGAAWLYHLRSLAVPYGLRFLPYTARLVVGVA